ncbi:MAG: hypothetical protein LBE12_14775 [Planctomycetaceae bacterium]|nr:hypothetical protein [Planctomycetaceae bacterium]
MAHAIYNYSRLKSACGTLHYQLSTINYYLALAGLWENGGVPDPAVKRSATAGYTFHTPSGVKSS